MIFDFLLKLFLLLTLIHPIFLDASMQFSLKLSKDNLGVNLQNQSDLDWNLKGRPGQGYYTSVLIGTPPQQNLKSVLDKMTNFAYFKVIADKRKHHQQTHSSTFKDLNVHINVPYTQGHWEGNLGSDFITLPNVLNSTVKANVACITESKDFFISTSDWQGILGLAYKEIARPDRSVEPYFDSLIKAGKSDNIFSIQLCGPFGHLYNDTGGVLVLGDIDSSLYLGDITYTPITREWYYEVVLTSIGVGNDTLDIQCIDLNDDKTIIDSGTTNFRLPTNIFNKLVSSIKKKLRFLSKTIPDRFWHGTKMMCWHNAEVIPWEDFPPIKLSLAHAWNSAFTITIAPQV
ncbi:Beta-secretase 1 [Nymphon striatum]|nr:Beta-secretase 1 [Nymphon striatum]